MPWNDWILLLAVIALPFIGMRHRQWIARGAFTLVAAIFWGALFAGLVGWAFDFLGDPRLIFAGLPVSIAVGVVMWKRLPKILDQQFK